MIDANDYLEGLMEGFVAYDGAWIMKYMNAAAERILGRRRGDVLGKTWHQAFPHAVGNPVDEMYQRVMRTRVPERMEYYYPHYQRWLEISASPAKDGGIGVYFADITERKSAEAALREREADLNDFFENAAVGLHWVGPDGTILRVNQAELDLLGYTREEYVGRNIAEFHADADTINDILHCLSSGQTLHSREARLRCRDGSIKHVLISSNVLFREGKFIHTRCFTRDITERKRAEDALREADRRKDEFLATLAHELRNPLAPVRNGLHLLRIVEPESPAAEQARAMMERQLDHLIRLVDDLLEVSRVSRGKIELRRQQVELSAVLMSAIETSRPAIEAARHALDIRLPAETVTLDADFVRLAQVVANLLNNAAKYTDPGGRISLAAWREGAHAVVCVRDTGIGIPADKLGTVFEMFAQVDSSLTRSQGGLGIGLALAKSLVELHGGTIEARSDGPGRGSEFVVRLPVAAAPAARSPAPRASERAPQPRRVLVVDDNVDAATSLGMMLSRMGHEVRVAHDGASALEFARSERPQVVLLDLSMQGMDGFGVARALRADPALARTPIVAVSGLGQDGDRRRTREAGFDEHLVKPVAPETLRAVFERF